MKIKNFITNQVSILHENIDDVELNSLRKFSSPKFQFLWMYKFIYDLNYWRNNIVEMDVVMLRNPIKLITKLSERNKI